MPIPSVAVELAAVISGFATGVPLGVFVHRRVLGPEWTGPWRARAAFWSGCFAGALVGQSVSMAVAGTQDSAAPAGTPMSAPDVLIASALLATLFTVVYVWKFKSGAKR